MEKNRKGGGGGLVEVQVEKMGKVYMVVMARFMYMAKKSKLLETT